jgi:hypothetical protein
MYGMEERAPIDISQKRKGAASKKRKGRRRKKEGDSGVADV